MNTNYQSLFDLPKIETKIREVIIQDQKVCVNFDSCNLRPTNGGQLFDKGRFYNGEWCEIKEVLYINDKIFCVTNTNDKLFNINETVLIEVDIERRNLISRMHSAIHLLSYLNKDKMINGYAGVSKSRIDFRGDFKKFKLNFFEIQKNFNKIVSEKKNINTKYLNKSDVDISNINEFVETESNICRIIEIDHYGSSMCYGTHVQNTQEIGNIRFDEPVITKDNIYKLNLYIA